MVELDRIVAIESRRVLCGDVFLKRRDLSRMDMTPFHDDCAFLGKWPGVPIADYEGVGAWHAFARLAPRSITISTLKKSGTGSPDS